MILRICFVKIKIHKFFQNFFDFFSVFWTPFTHKKIFLHFWAKNNLLLCTWRATCPFYPPKVLFRGLFFKVSLKRPPWCHIGHVRFLSLILRIYYLIYFGWVPEKLVKQVGISQISSKIRMNEWRKILKKDIRRYMLK